MDFSTKTMLCVGDVMIDSYMLGQVSRISPEAPVPILQLSQSRSVLGGAGNVARNIAALGGRAILTGLIGADSAANELSNLIRETYGIIDATVSTELRPTTCKSRVVADRQQIIRIDKEMELPARPAELMDLVASVDKWIDKADAVILSDYGKGVVVPELIHHVIARARVRGIGVFVDPKSSDFARYSGATCISPNLKELATASGRTPHTEDEIVEAARKLLTVANAEALLVTRSQHGMILVTRTGHVSAVPARALEVFDVSGAGDTAIAVFSLACASGVTMPQAMRLANIAAGIVVGKPGTAIVTTEELKHELELGAHGIIDSSSPLISRTAAANLSHQWKEAALRVGFTNGCFDILHAGHISILQQGRSKCDRLLVGLNTDAGVRRLKGPQRPVNTLEDRARVLSAIKYIDAIVPFGEETPRALIEMLQPDVLIKGSDYTMDTVVGADLVQANGGTVFLADIMSERSTTGIISRIRNLA